MLVRIALVITLVGCGAAPVPSQATTGTCVDPVEDLDGDGHCLAFDCDESDATRFVYAEDFVGDGVDRDCDGMDD